MHGLALRIPVVGVMAKADFTGLQLLQSELANRSYIPPPVKGYSSVLDRLIAAGRSGVIAGKGYYDWGGRSPAEWLAERDRKLLALKRALAAIAPMHGVEEENP